MFATISRRAGLASLSLALLFGLTGCGSSFAPVSGKVTLKGAAIKGGTLVFSPADGNGNKPATADIQPDGTYTLISDRATTGAMVGKYRVAFTPPAPLLTDAQRTNPRFNAPPPLYQGYTLKQTEVEVTAGTNQVDLELIRQ